MLRRCKSEHKSCESRSKHLTGVGARHAAHAIGEGAAIVLDPQGNFATSRNCEGLYRGWITKDGKISVRLYEE